MDLYPHMAYLSLPLNNCITIFAASWVYVQDHRTFICGLLKLCLGVENRVEGIIDRVAGERGRETICSFCNNRVNNADAMISLNKIINYITAEASKRV